MNVLHYDEWKDTDAVEIMTMFLDAVVTEFLTKIEDIRDNGTIEGKRAFLLLGESIQLR